MKPRLCLCAAYVARKTRHHVRVVVHDVELQKSTNSGRLLPLLLEQAALVPYGGGHVPLDVQHAVVPGTKPFVLFPQQGVPTIDDAVAALAPTDTATLIVLDGTWHQANRLRKRFLAERIPFVRLRDDDVRPSLYQLRTGHFEHSMSTLEATARALAVLEGDVDVDAHLVDGFRRMVDRTLWLRGSLAPDAVYGGLPEGVTRHGINDDVALPTPASRS